MNRSLLLVALLISTHVAISAQEVTLDTYRLPKLTVIPRLAVYSFQAKTVQINGPATVNGTFTVDGPANLNGTVTVTGQLLVNGSPISGSPAVITITTDSGSVTGNALSLSGVESGPTVIFSGSGTTITLTMTDANGNTVIGAGAGVAITPPASNNTILGVKAGNSLTTETGNICIDSTGAPGMNNAIFIGSTGSAAAFIGGIHGVTTGVADAIPVLVDSNGQLGTVSSSIKYKKNIQDIDPQTTKLLELRPVTFNYKQHESDELHFGLIAEEVKELMPELVIRDKNGDVLTVKYHELPALLLAHIKQLNAKNEELEAQLISLNARITVLEAS